MNHTVEEAFNLGTIHGARAAKMEGRIGTLKVGAYADVLVWDALGVGMVCAAQEDPVAAVVVHSSPGDLECVVVGGVVRKEGGVWKNVDGEAGREVWSGVKKAEISWKEVCREVLGRREVLKKKIEGIDMDVVREGVIKAFHVDESLIVDSV